MYIVYILYLMEIVFHHSRTCWSVMYLIHIFKDAELNWINGTKPTWAELHWPDCGGADWVEFVFIRLFQMGSIWIKLVFIPPSGNIFLRSIFPLSRMKPNAFRNQKDVNKFFIQVFSVCAILAYFPWHLGGGGGMQLLVAHHNIS